MVAACLAAPEALSVLNSKDSVRTIRTLYSIHCTAPLPETPVEGFSLPLPFPPFSSDPCTLTCVYYRMNTAWPYPPHRGC